MNDKPVRWWRWWLIACLAGAACTAGRARPVVAVSFDLAVPRWVNTFGDQRDALQAKAAQAVASWLDQQMGFVDFEAGSSGPHRLVLHLEVAPDAGTRPYKETQLRLELLGQPTAQPLVWRFRPDDRFGEPTGGVDGLVREIGLRLGGIDKQALVRQVLSRVPIASEAQLWKDPVGWVIPYSRTDLCMDLRSLLHIENMMPSGAGPVLKEYDARATGDFKPPEAQPAAATLRGRVFTEPQTSPEGLAELGRAKADQVAIRAVYIVEYQPLATCSRPVPPEAVDFRGGTR